MEINGEYTFDAPLDLVWQALQDPDVLSSAMPGGEGFEEVGENEYAGRLNVKVGPVQGKFNGNIKLTDVVDLQGYRIEVDGKGAPGFVKAEGRLQLTGQGAQTHMAYEGEARIGGRIASVGQRLLDASAKSIIRQSLEGLNAYLQAQVAAADGAAAADEGADKRIEEVAPAMPPGYVPPSQTQVALTVAKDVFEDLVPEAYRPAVLGGAAALLVLILFRLLKRD
ncbi:MAG: carbon monoxide dehydrogenase subunit G [Anaerolineales bacterium]|nr:carbon monoxide dehydrogenase subunit G [Anaerolineales bacterium]